MEWILLGIVAVGFSLKWLANRTSLPNLTKPGLTLSTSEADALIKEIGADLETQRRIRLLTLPEAQRAIFRALLGIENEEPI